MNSLPIIAKLTNEDGNVEYHVIAEPSWDGFDSLAKYLVKHWQAVPFQKNDEVYSRHWSLRVGEVSISLHHDSQKGNYFSRSDGEQEQTLLENIEADITRRLNKA